MRLGVGRGAWGGRRLALVSLLALLVCAGSAIAQIQQQEPAVAVPLTAEQAARYEHFTHELRCLVCQNQTIAESQAPLAMDLREKVRQQIAGGKSDTEVIAWLTERYGDYVLYRPPFKASTVLLWLGPFLLMLAGLFVARRYASHSTAAPQPQAPDSAAVQRLLSEHGAAAASVDSNKPQSPS